MKFFSSFLLILLILVSLMGYHSFQESMRWFNAYYEMKQSQEYYFDGANKRNLLDICKNSAGIEGVWFKEECVE